MIHKYYPKRKNSKGEIIENDFTDLYYCLNEDCIVKEENRLFL